MESTRTTEAGRRRMTKRRDAHGRQSGKEASVHDSSSKVALNMSKDERASGLASKETAHGQGCLAASDFVWPNKSRAHEMRLRLGFGVGGKLMSQIPEMNCRVLWTTATSYDDKMATKLEAEANFKPDNCRQTRAEPIETTTSNGFALNNKRIVRHHNFNQKLVTHNNFNISTNNNDPGTQLDESKMLKLRTINKETLPMKKTHHHQHQLSFRDSCSSSISFIIKLFLICHLIQSLVTRRGPEIFEQHDGHLSVRWWSDRKLLFETFSVSGTFGLLVSAADSGEWTRPANEADGDFALIGEGSSEELEARPAHASRGADRLLKKDILIHQKIGPDEQEHRATPLELIKHTHNHHHHHHHHHHRHHHGRTHSNRQQTTMPPEVVDKPTQAEENEAAKSTSQRVRRHHGGFYDVAADRPVVASRKGLVRGLTQKLFTGKFVDAFLGIPYAKPPIGDYRFRHPQPTDSWAGELDASRLPNSCYQVNDTFFGANFQGTVIWNANTPLSEDCLYLNIWTPFGVANTTVPSTPNKVYRPAPSTGEPSKASKRPVLVWIFGGGFYYGTSTLALYEGGLLASEEDIIVVSINYRVSALGFLYFGRPDAPGNAGLFDQMLALQWIQDNIDQFGGDPSRVTIFGESAGAVSAAFHLLSPLSRNLFSQAILQSGAATCPWGCMEPREIMTNGLKLASLLNCPSNASDLDSVLDCLLRIDPMSLVLIAQDVDPNMGLLNFPFVPVVDGSFLLELPSESLIKSNFKRAKILLGSNYDEGSAFLIYLTEFNHCPGDAEHNNNEPSGKSTPSSTQVVAKQQAPSHEANAKYLSPATGGPPSSSGDGELRDQSMDSMELVAPPGRQTPAALLAAPQPNNDAEGGLGGSGGGGGRSTQHNLPPNYSDSNPCKPNESPALTRDAFLRTLNKHLNPYAEHPIGKEAIVFEYSNWNNPLDSVSNYDALDKIVGDYHFTCHVNEFAQRYASTGNAVFMYYFKQRSSVSQWPKWMGVMHGDEIAFVFGEPLNQLLNYTSREVELSRRMMKYWANFAKFGNPTKLSENVSMPEVWPEYSNNRQYFELHGDLIRIGRGPRAKQCAFWAHYLPKLIDSFDHNQCPASSNAATRNSISSNHQYRCPPMYHPLDPSFNADHQRSGLLNNLPSLVIVSLSVILVLSIIGLLIYAKRTGKLELNLSSGSNSD